MKMKKIFTAVVCLSVFLVSCKDDDTTPPKFQMNGASTITISLNSPFNDPGVSANDDEDGSVTVTSNISPTNPDINLTGHYIITYTATDAAGNSDEITRNVIVVNDAAFLAGAYNVFDSCGTMFNYVDGVIASTTVNNRIIFNQIGRYTNASDKLTADVDVVPPQPAALFINAAVINCGTFPNIVDRSFSGSGYVNQDTIRLNVIEQVLPSGTPDTCSYTYVRQ
jgi:hypothetical protein